MRHVNGRLSRDGDAGSTLVELLVVMLILGVVGGIVVAGVTSGLRTTSHAQARVDSLAKTQMTIERVSREMRAADPVREVTEDWLMLDVCRDDGLRHYRYSVTAVGDEWELVEERWDFPSADCPDPDTEPTEPGPSDTSVRTLVEGLTEAAVFTAVDRDGNVLNGTATENADEAYRLVIRARRAVQDDLEPIEVETTVTLRNR